MTVWCQLYFCIVWLTVLTLLSETLSLDKWLNGSRSIQKDSYRYLFYTSFTSTQNLHLMAIAVSNNTGIKMWIHYPIILNMLHRLRVLNVWLRIICYRLLFDCLHVNMHFMYGTLHSFYLLLLWLLILCLYDFICGCNCLV